MKRSYLYIAVLCGSLLSGSCKKSFLDRPSLDGTTLDNYYNTAEEVRTLTSTLYGLPWTGYLNRAMDCIGDVMAGNAYTGAGNADDAPFKMLTLAPTAIRVADAWKVFYKIGGWTSEYIKALEEKKARGGNATFIDPAIAECHFMRGTVYFFIARTWGAAPIVTDPGKTALSGNFSIPRYFQEDVLRFAAEELEKAEAGLPEEDIPGRLTKYSAKGMLAKLYLYQKEYDKAKVKAGEVMASGKFELIENFAGMFSSSTFNNNKESLFSIQHQLTGNPWGSASQKQCDRGPSNLGTDEANMWELYVPTIDFVENAFESGDKRRDGTIMEHGWVRNSWKPQRTGDDAYNNFMAGGYKYDTLQSLNAGGTKNDTRSNIAKYVVGPGSKYGGEAVIGMNTGINTMILRYADVLLIYAEATLKGQGSTSDAEALKAYNAVRERAGLLPKNAITINDIMRERRAELAFEGEYWYDVQRQGYAKAKEIILAQNRGTADTEWKVTSFNEANMYVPIPSGEVLQNPELAKPPVSFY